MRAGSLIAAIALFAACAAPAANGGPPADPQPRLLHDMHGARINQIRPTPDGQRLVTVGQDKTLRVWRLSDLRLLRTVHVPSGEGEEGSLRSLAVLPDGQEAIVGGWTGLSWAGSAQLYRVRLDTGRIVQTIRGLPALVESLSLSADGRRLAVGLGARAGLKVIDTGTGRELWADAAYGGGVGFADHAPDGTLATTSSDGCLRLYDADGRLRFRAEYPPRSDAGPQCRGSALGGVRFSPDGRRLAFGLQDRVEVVVFDVAQQRIVQRLAPDAPEQRSLCCPNWSADGRRLHAHGLFDSAGSVPVWRFTLDGGAVERLDAGRERLTNVLPLLDGGLVASSAAPGLVRLAADGRVVARAEPPNADFRFAWDRWRLDPTGTRVLLPVQGDGAPMLRFAPTEPPDRALRAARPEDAGGLAPPRRTPGRVQARLDDLGWQSPVLVNARPVALAPYQAVRSWADGERHVVLGTQWSVVVLGPDGSRMWERDLPAPAWQVAVGADGRLVVVAVGDGTLRWFAADTGRELLGAFLHANGRDWIAWRPDGLYASSPGGDEFFGWLLNEGDGREPLVVRAVQLERTLYRPELVRAALGTGATPVRAGAPALRQVPRVRIESVSEATREVRFSVQAADAAPDRVAVFVDDVPLASRAAAQPLLTAGGLHVVTVPPGLPLERLRIEAEADRLLGIDEMVLLRPWAAARRPGTLWVLAAGVEQFPAFKACGRGADCRFTVPELPNAPRDAAELAARLRQAAGSLFADVRVRTLGTPGGSVPTKADLQAALAELQQAAATDTVLVFLASHGFAGAGGDYWFLPRDATPADLARALDDAGATTLPSLLGASELNDMLRRVPGRRALVIDTCHAGAGVSRNPYTVAKRSASSRYAVLSASTGDELSYEYPDPKVPHGAFTWALLDALQGAADADGDGELTLDEAFRHVGPQVARLVAQLNRAERRRNPAHLDFTQTPVLQSPDSLRATPLARVRRP